MTGSAGKCSKTGNFSNLLFVESNDTDVLCIVLLLLLAFKKCPV